MYSDGIQKKKATDLFETPLKTALTVAEIFDRCGVDYFIGGSVASSLLGESRTTRDIDFVANIRQEHISLLIKIWGKDFYVPEQTFREAVKQHSSFNLIPLNGSYKVDIFILKNTPFHQEEMRRRKSFTVSKDPEETLQLSTPEDIILQKLLWYESGKRASSTQWRDVLGVLKYQKVLDFSYLQSTAKTLGISSLLEQALQESGNKTGNTR